METILLTVGSLALRVDNQLPRDGKACGTHTSLSHVTKERKGLQRSWLGSLPLLLCDQTGICKKGADAGPSAEAPSLTSTHLGGVRCPG